jgi:hypothetical protein
MKAKAREAKGKHSNSSKRGAKITARGGAEGMEIVKWVICYVPEFEKCWQAYERPVGDSWRLDETYLKVGGQWMYLYRAVDKQGKTVEFLPQSQP